LSIAFTTITEIAGTDTMVPLPDASANPTTWSGAVNEFQDSATGYSTKDVSAVVQSDLVFVKYRCVGFRLQASSFKALKPRIHISTASLETK
jgi:hypothetical protein